MDDNTQQQADEIAVLQSIYADDVIVKDETSLEINVNIPIKPPFSVISPPPPRPSPPITSTSSSSDDPSVSSSSSSEDPSASSSSPPEDPSSSSSSSSTLLPASALGEALPVVALPPILLTVTYHPSYPSDEPPMFTMSCCWLSEIQLTELCKQLDQIWADSKGEVVVFRWVSWLMEESLAFLDIRSPYVLPIYDVTPDRVNELDARAESTCDRFTIGLLIDFDKFARRELFFQTEHTCGICYMDYPGIQFVHQTTCEHPFCKDCMRQMCQINIQEGSIAEIKCPDKQCRKQVLPQVVRGLVNDETYTRYERLLLDRSLNSMEDVMWCPHCSFAVIIDDKIELGACTNCGFSFCTNCMQSWHPSRACKSGEGVVESMRQRAISAKKDQLEKIKAEIESVAWMVGHTKMCPKCKIPIEKTEGCNKMTCFKCGQYFCWNCRKAISGYDHFGGACKLFPDTPLYHADGQVIAHNVDRYAPRPAAMRREVTRQVQMMNVQQQLLHNPDMVKRCPRCKTQCAKTNNNNHIACWNCGTQFCFLCMEYIFGTAHFHKGKCKHHT
eukprot:Phypoly_transcript_06513.p1 GENE.Phypoly_transcript_06513~~Phypoly_transcript_06513.p1  ORF type:complete len:557 (+),score=99.32 Phypoly_transcript_06513:24-1694(+)